MPRLTNIHYLRQRNELRIDWFDHQAWTFSRLEPIEEMELHSYIALTKSFTDEQALVHRRLVSRQDSSLPHRTGRAFAHAKAYLGTAPRAVPNSTSLVRRSVSRAKPVRGEVIVYSVQRPEPDVQRVIEILRRIETQQNDRNHEEHAA